MNPLYKKEIKVRMPRHIAEPFTRICQEHRMYPATGLIRLANALVQGWIGYSQLFGPLPQKAERPTKKPAKPDRTPKTSKPKGDRYAQGTAKAQKNN